EKYRVPAGKIDVVYNGYGGEYRVIDDVDELERVRSRYGLERHFLYFPAATWPHKNHRRLLGALRILVDRYRFDGQLVLTGISMKSHGDILKEIERLDLGEQVKILGYLPYAELPYLYNLARLLVFPSLFEGFGLPLVEAMACGCPVVCSDVTAIPEVIGKAGLLFDPTAEEDIAAKIWSAWNDEELRKRLVALGFQRAGLFRWEKAALQTIEVYKKALGISSSDAGTPGRGEKS
ncbi:MAG: glycosyltransferase family 1 protein, partial [Desulfuromonadales bacterium]